MNNADCIKELLTSLDDSSSTLFDETLQNKEFFQSYHELSRLSRIGLTQSLAIENFLYRRSKLIQGTDYDYEHKPNSEMNIACRALAKQVDPDRWQQIINPSRPPATRRGITQENLLEKDGGKNELFKAIAENNVENFLEMACIIPTLYLDAHTVYSLEYEMHFNALRYAMLKHKFEITEKIIQLLDDQYVEVMTNSCHLHWLSSSDFSSLSVKIKFADMLLNQHPLKIINSSTQNNTIELALDKLFGFGNYTPLDYAFKYRQYDFGPYLIDRGATFTTCNNFPAPSHPDAAAIFVAFSKRTNLSTRETAALASYANEVGLINIIKLFQDMNEKHAPSEWKFFITELINMGARIDVNHPDVDKFEDLIRLQKRLDTSIVTKTALTLYNNIASSADAFLHGSQKLKMD